MDTKVERPRDGKMMNHRVAAVDCGSLFPGTSSGRGSTGGFGVWSRWRHPP